MDKTEITPEKREELEQLRAQADTMLTSAKETSATNKPDVKKKLKKVGKTLWRHKGLIFAAFGFILSLFGLEASADDSSGDFGFDSDGDGDIDSWGIDTDGDGVIDTIGTDMDGDGIIDSIGMDSNGDGMLDAVVRNGQNGAKEMLIDSDGDGFVDMVAIDLDGDGTIDAIN